MAGGRPFFSRIVMKRRYENRMAKAKANEKPQKRLRGARGATRKRPRTWGFVVKAEWCGKTRRQVPVATMVR